MLEGTFNLPDLFDTDQIADVLTGGRTSGTSERVYLLHDLFQDLVELDVSVHRRNLAHLVDGLGLNLCRRDVRIVDFDRHVLVDVVVVQKLRHAAGRGQVIHKKPDRPERPSSHFSCHQVVIPRK